MHRCLVLFAAGFAFLLAAMVPALPLAAQPDGSAHAIGSSPRVDGTPAQPSPVAKACGEYVGPDVGPRVGPVSDDSIAALNCFHQAYQQCTPATLEIPILSILVGRETLSLQGVPGGCSVAGAWIAFQRAVPEGQDRKEEEGTWNCTQLTRTDSGLLRLSGCTGTGDRSLGN
jgi:hypothetical protein